MSNKKTSNIKVPMSFTNFVNKHLNKQLQSAIKKELKRSGLGTASIPDTRSQKTRAAQKQRLAKDVATKFKKENPRAYNRLKSK